MFRRVLEFMCKNNIFVRFFSSCKHVVISACDYMSDVSRRLSVVKDLGNLKWCIDHKCFWEFAAQGGNARARFSPACS